jgi:integrase
LHGSPIEVFTDIHAKDFLHYVKTDLQRHNTTRNQYRVNLKHLFALLKEREVIEKNPFDKTKKLPTVKTSKKPYNKQQQSLLKDYISSANCELWLAVQFIYYCFIRPNELRQLKLEDIDLEQGKIFVRGEIAKNKKTNM